MRTARIVQLIYTLTILGTCAYVVFGLGHTGWWFAFAVFVLTCSEDAFKKED